MGWVREGGGARAEGGSEARLSGLLADVLGGGAGACRRAPLRRSVLAQLLHYCRKLLHAPANAPNTPGASGAANAVNTLAYIHK